MTVLTPGARKAAIAFILVTAVLDILAMGIVIPVLPALIEGFVGSNADAGWWTGTASDGTDPFDRTIRVPFPPESEASGIADRGHCRVI